MMTFRWSSPLVEVLSPASSFLSGKKKKRSLDYAGIGIVLGNIKNCKATI